MVIDAHGHVTAPDSLYVYKAGLLSHRGGARPRQRRRHGRGHHQGAERAGLRRLVASGAAQGSGHRHAVDLAPSVSDDAQREPQAGDAGSPKRPTTSSPAQVKLLPEHLPRRVRLAAEPRRQPQGGAAVPRKMRQGARLRRMPDQSRSGRVQRHRDSSAGRPLLVSAVRKAGGAGHSRTHSFGRCRSERLTYSLHFINEESIAVVSLLNSNVFTDFPTLQILFRTAAGRSLINRRASKPARCAAACRVSPTACGFCITTRCCTPRSRWSCCSRPWARTAACSARSGPGVGTVKDPRTGKWLDETRHLIEAFDWLSAADKKMIFEDNAKKIFKLDVTKPADRSSRKVSSERHEDRA